LKTLAGSSYLQKGEIIDLITHSGTRTEKLESQVKALQQEVELLKGYRHSNEYA